MSSATLGTGLLLVALLVGIVNYFGWKYHRRFDWTSSALYSLSGKSHGVVAGLDQDVEVVVLMDPASNLYSPTKELLDRYTAASPRISVEVIDPQRNPARAQQLVDRYQISVLNSVVFESGADRRVVEEADLAEYDYSHVQYGQEPQVRSFKGEQLFTGAILELVEQRKPRILFVTGHGEASLDDYSARGLSQSRELLGEDNFDQEEWTSLGQAQVPAGTELVVVAGPRARFLAHELELLDRYLESGGRVLVLAEPILGPEGLEPTGLEEWLEAYGVALGEHIVIDRARSLPLFGAERFFVNDYLSHPVTAALAEAQLPVLLTHARSVSQRAEAPAGVDVSELLDTSAEAWEETDLDDLVDPRRDEAERAGPLSLGVAVTLAAAGPPAGGQEGRAPGAGEGGQAAAEEEATAVAAGDPTAPPAQRQGRLVVLGDLDFATNSSIADGYNATLLLNSVNWLVERPNLLGIPAKQAEEVRLNLTRGELGSITWFVLLVMPGSSLAAAAFVYYRRRR